MNIGIVYNSFAHKRLLPEEKELRDTGIAIGKHLIKLGHQVQYFDMDSPREIEKLCNSSIDVAFDTSERIRGDSRGEAYTAALLEFLDIPHSRTSSFYIAMGINKVRVKHILAYNGITIPRFQVFASADEKLRPDLKFPLFVKGVATENSIGIDKHSVVTNPGQLKRKVRQINTELKQPALVEEFIGGREFAVAILPGKINRPMPLLEIEFDALPPNRRYLDYDAKWVPSSSRYKKTTPVFPQDLTKEEIAHINETAMRCFTVLGLDSYVRVDMRYNDHTLYVLEVNQNPSIGEDGCGYVRTAQGLGLDYTALIQHAAPKCDIGGNMKIVILEPVEPDSATAKKISHIHSLLEKKGDELIHQIADNNLFASLMKHQPDVVFNLASVYGWEKTNLIPAVLEIAGVRYTGSSMMGLSLARHASKLFPLLLASGVPMAPFVITKAGSPALPDDFYYPLTLFCDGLRRGQIINSHSELKNALKNLFYREDVAIQELISGEKTSIYILDSAAFLEPKDPDLLEFALKAYQLLEARGLARFDFVKSDRYYLDDIDLSPDPLDKDFVRSATDKGWDEMKILRILLKHASRDIKAPRKKTVSLQFA